MAAGIVMEVSVYRYEKRAFCGEFSWLFCTKVFRIHLIRRVTAADAGSRHVSQSFACSL